MIDDQLWFNAYRTLISYILIYIASMLLFSFSKIKKDIRSFLEFLLVASIYWISHLCIFKIYLKFAGSTNIYGYLLLHFVWTQLLIVLMLPSFKIIYSFIKINYIERNIRVEIFLYEFIILVNLFTNSKPT